MCQARTDKNQVTAASCAAPATLTAEVKILNAVTGELRSTLNVDPAWTVRRLSTEIASATGVSPMEQRLVVPGAVPIVLERAGARSVADALGGVSELLLVRMPAPRDDDPQGLAPGTVIVTEGALGTSGPSQVVRWVVDANIFSKNSRSVVSPKFDLDLGGELGSSDFKLSLVPHGNVSFSRAQGRGFVHLKSQSELPAPAASLSFTISVRHAADGMASAASLPELKDTLIAEECGCQDVEEHDFARAAFWKHEHDPLVVSRSPVSSSIGLAGLCTKKVVLVRLEVFGLVPPRNTL